MISANALLQQLRAAGMEPRVMLIEKAGTVLRDERAKWEHKAVAVPWRIWEGLPKCPRAERWK